MSWTGSAMIITSNLHTRKWRVKLESILIISSTLALETSSPPAELAVAAAAVGTAHIISTLSVQFTQPNVYASRSEAEGSESLQDAEIIYEERILCRRQLRQFTVNIVLHRQRETDTIWVQLRVAKNVQTELLLLLSRQSCSLELLHSSYSLFESSARSGPETDCRCSFCIT